MEYCILYWTESARRTCVNGCPCGIFLSDRMFPARQNNWHDLYQRWKRGGIVRIQHNITSLNAYRNLSGNNDTVAKNLEKLSSGYRINRAGDDAAGLAVSEKMRALITGLEQAGQNAEDGVSLVQTVEGATTEVHSMLNRMMEISVQSANGTYTDEERAMMDQEMQQLKTEISRIGNTSSFNSIPLFTNGGSGSAAEGMTTYGLTLDLAKGTFEVNYVDRSGAAAAGGAGRAAGANATLADKIAKEYFPNAISQILGSFDSLKQAIGSDKVGMEIHIGNIDGNGKILAYAQFSFRQTGKAGNMLLRIDSSDFSDASVDTPKLESTIAHELMHSVMQYTMTDGMSGRNGASKFPEWFSEGTAQLAGGGFPTNWNAELAAIADKLSGETDGSQDGAIANYLKKYTVPNRPYGHGYLAAAYLGYLANGGGDVNSTNIAKGMDKIFGELTADSKNGIFTAIGKYTSVKSQNDLDRLFSNPPAELVEFARKLAYNSKGGAGSVIAAGGLGGADIIGNTASADDQPFYVTDVATKPTGTGSAGTGKTGTSTLQLMVGAENDSNNVIEVDLFQLDPAALRLTSTDVLTQDKARSAIDDVKAAIDEVSSIRSYYGALQNRLEHTINNLGSMVENLSASESRIRDTDMAKAMMEHVRNQILVQSSQAMLAQANQQPTSVLQLLNG